jgi:hypothetical protein
MTWLIEMLGSRKLALPFRLGLYILLATTLGFSDH